MDIPSCARLGRISAALCVVMVGLTAEQVHCAHNKTAIDALIATYKAGPTLTKAEAESAAGNLEKALADCRDSYLVFRIRYRIAVVYFKANMMVLSEAKFLRIAHDRECPELIRICSLNMIGQISRLEGRYKRALDAFGRVATDSGRQLAATGECTGSSALTRLWCAALFSRAEIYETQRDYAAAISEYKRLLSMLAQSKNDKMLREYAPLAGDRMSQLYLQRGDIDRYVELAEELPGDYPQYYRAPILKLEVECVKFLRVASESCQFPNGGFSAPARAVGYFKSTKQRVPASDIPGSLHALCQETQSPYCKLLLRYHYAWLLETLVKKDKAIEILTQISSANPSDTNDGSPMKKVAEIITEYAKIQSVIMLGEQADYKQAQRILGTLAPHQDESHLSKLSESVKQNIVTLESKVPKHEGQ